MPWTRTAGLNEERVMHALGIDDAYRVERTLAEGPTGVTQCVTIDGSGPFVRKKIPSSLANRVVWAALAGCESPRLPQIAATYEMPDCFVAVYDYVPGDTLESIVAVRGRLTAAEAVRIARDVCDAVSNLHEHGIIHCDIAPSNVVIAVDGAHLIDFGIAQPVQASSGTARLGTWGFAAPEQYGFASVDARSDVYSIAQMLGYMLTGVEPDSDNDAFAQALADSSAIPPALAEVLQRGSAFEPSARYQSSEELSCAIAAAYSAWSVGVGDAGGSCQANLSIDAQTRSRSNGFLQQGLAESARAHCAAREKPQKRQDRINAAVKTGVLSIAIASSVAGVALLAVGNFSHVMQRYQSFFSEMDQDAKDVAAGDGVLSDGDKRDIVPSAAQEESREGFDAARGSWLSDIFSSSADADTAFEALSIESGWSLDSRGYVHYAFVLTNAESGFKVELPMIKIVGRDSADTVLFSEEISLPVIEPGQRVSFGECIGNGKAPASVELDVIRPGAHAVSEGASESPVFEVDNVSEVSDGFGGSKFTGEVKYFGGEWPEFSQGSIAVTIVLRDDAGEIVYGATGYVKRPAEGEATTFEVAGGRLPEYAVMEAYAQAW